MKLFPIEILFLFAAIVQLFSFDDAGDFSVTAIASGDDNVDTVLITVYSNLCLFEA
jgi:hypothetical protein